LLTYFASELGVACFAVLVYFGRVGTEKPSMSVIEHIWSTTLIDHKPGYVQVLNPGVSSNMSQHQPMLF
jgi:hypothetical protein